MTEFFVPQISPEDIEHANQVAKNMNRAKAKSWLSRNIFNICNLIISMASLVVAIVALFK